MPLFKFICPLLLAVYTVAPAFANALTVGAPGNPFDGDCATFGCTPQYQQVYGAGLFPCVMSITALDSVAKNSERV